jgi:TctA family transporter
MSNLLTLNYWFNLQPDPLLLFAQRALLWFVILLAVVALIIAIVKNLGGIYRGFFKRLYSFCLTNALLGLLLIFFNYETVPFFSARFWLGLWALLMIIWLIFIFRKLKTIPTIKKQLAEEQALKKYLP